MGAYEPGWVPCINTRPVDVLRYNRTCSYDHMITDPHRKDRRIAADGDMAPDKGRLPFSSISARRPSFGKKVIDEHDPMPDKAMIAYFYQLANKSMGLYPAITPDLHFFLYLSKRSDKGIIANGAAIQVVANRRGLPGFIL